MEIIDPLRISGVMVMQNAINSDTAFAIAGLCTVWISREGVNTTSVGPASQPATSTGLWRCASNGNTWD